MRPILPTLVFTLIAAICGASVAAQNPPALDNPRYGMLREALLGVQPAAPAVSDTEARQHCLRLPAAPPSERLQGPHGDSLLTTTCEVIAYQPGPKARPRWIVARYRWTSRFAPQDTTGGRAAPDSVGEEEVVLFARTAPGRVRPVWHARFETGAYSVWASITAELAPASGSATLLGVQSCVNGTGGCSQEFLQGYPDGRWAPVWQVWLDQLPPGFLGRIRHGVRIDPATLRGEAPFYTQGDANCCPSERLLVRLRLRGDSLALLSDTVVAEPDP